MADESFFAVGAGAAARGAGAFAAARDGAFRAGESVAVAAALAGGFPFPAPLAPPFFAGAATLAARVAGVFASPVRLGRGPPDLVVVVSVVMVLFAFWLRAGEAAFALVVAGSAPRRPALFAPSPVDVAMARPSAVELAGAASRALVLVALFVAMGKDLLPGPEGARR